MRNAKPRRTSSARGARAQASSRRPFTPPRKGTEREAMSLSRSAMLKWRRVLERAGVEFLDPTEDGRGEGVRFRSRKGSS